MKDTINQYHKQHYSNYTLAIENTVVNNTNSLMEEDLLSFFSKPPLDSMDVIKNKMLCLAKENEIILNSEKLDRFLTDYRDQASQMVKDSIEERTKKVLATFNQNKKTENKVYRLSVSSIQKISNTVIKNIDTSLKSLLFSDIEKKVRQLVDQENGANEQIDLFVFAVIHYLKNVYLPNLKLDIKQKWLIRDYILINNIKEQGNRYLFTEKHSRIYQV